MCYHILVVLHCVEDLSAGFRSGGAVLNYGAASCSFNVMVRSEVQDYVW